MVATDPLFPPTTDPSPATHTWTIDTSAPDAAITNGPANPTSSTNASFSFSSTDPTATFECQLDGGGFSACPDPKSYSGLSSATHTFQVRGVDDAGNSGPVDSFTWTIDTAAPTATITNGPANPTSSTSASFSFTSNDAGASFECQLDSGGFSACTDPAVYLGLSATSHTFQVRAQDGAGNTGAADTYTWTIDTSAPTATITNTPPNPSGSTSASFSFTSNDAGASFECQLDGGGFSDCTNPKSYSGLAATSHTFEVRAKDSVGNTGTAASYTWTIDTTAPGVTITNGPTNPTNATSASFSFSSPDPTASFECQLDGGGFTSCTSPKPYSGLSAATHTFQVRATDNSGNVSSPASHTWTIDTAVPDVVITSGPSGTTNSTAVHFEFSSVDSGASFECERENGGFSACASPQDYTVVDGSHTFRVRAKDGAGNIGPAVARTWAVDTTAPDTTINTGPPLITASPDASFSFTSTESGVFQCHLDGANWEPCSSPRTYSGLPSGTHTFHVRAIDPANNVDPSRGDAHLDDRHDRAGDDDHLRPDRADRPELSDRSGSRPAPQARPSSAASTRRGRSRAPGPRAPRRGPTTPWRMAPIRSRFARQTSLGRRTRRRQPVLSASIRPLPILRSPRPTEPDQPDHRQLRVHLDRSQRDLHMQHGQHEPRGLRPLRLTRKLQPG